jgi:sugar lactone lactonase YvrE
MDHTGYGYSFFRGIAQSSQPALTLSQRPWGWSRCKGLATAAKNRLSVGAYLTLAACLLFQASIQSAAAQAAFPAGLVGGTAQTQTVPVPIQSAGTVDHVKILTQGSEGLDFKPSPLQPPMGCSSIVGPVCNVSVNFLPQYPGLRIGAVQIFDSGGHLMGTQNISGFGTGSLSVMAPGQITTVAGDGCLSDGPCLNSGNTPATKTSLSLPLGEATDAAGNLYVSDTGHNRILEVLKINPSGNNPTIVAGSISGASGITGDNGPAQNALINAPSTITVDGSGNIFFADTGNNAIREINAITLNISTIAGTLGTSGSDSSHLSAPQGFVFDASGNLYIADTGNNRVQKVDTLGIVSTVAGTYNQPWGVAISSKDGSLYIADFGANYIFKVNASNVPTIVAGNGTPGYSPDGVAATSATLNGPSSIALDPADNLYIADSENNVVRKVNISTGKISTLVGIAGDGNTDFNGDGLNAQLANLYKPYSIYLDGAGNLFVADRLNLRIREVSATISAIQYPTMKEGKTSAPVIQTIENDGNAALTLTNLTVPPPPSGTTNAVLDPHTTTCSISAPPLAIGADCNLGVEFTPPADLVPPVPPGAPPSDGVIGTGMFSVTSDSGNSPIYVELSGTVLSVDPSSTTVTADHNPAGINQLVMLTAQIASPNQVTGTVEFFDNGVSIGSKTVPPNTDTVVFTTAFNMLGIHVITAVYGGDSLNAASTPNPPLNLNIQQTTTLRVDTSANPSVEFSPITLTAQLGGWTVVPTGNITFKEGSTSLGSATIDGTGKAVFPLPPLAVNLTGYNIIATFAGDINDFGSTGTITQTINRASTSTTLNASNTVIPFSTPITFTATVTGVPSSTPTGNVIFKDGSSNLMTVPVNALGVATYVNSTLAAGAHTITAVYQGDTNYTGSTSIQIIQVTIQQTATNTTISASTTNSVASRPITLTATVTAASNVPAGTVNFMNGNILIGTGTLNNKGVASVVTSTLPVGTNNVNAIYSGDSNDITSASISLPITIVKTTTTTVVSSSQNPIETLTPVVISATVANGGTQSPTGLVTFSEDSVAIGVGTLNAGGVATISIPFLTVGSHTFLAAYAGDGLDYASSSAPFTQTVQLRPTTDALTSSATSLTGGQQLTLISVIRPTEAAGSKPPTGTVTFMDGKTTLATSPIDATGVATVTVLLSGTSASISSTYNGDANYAASSSAPTTVTIGPAPDFTLDATPLTWQMQSKQHQDIQLSLTSVRNFTDTFVLGCLGLPQDATCTFSKDSTTLPAGGSVSVTLTVDTGNPLLGGTPASNTQASNNSPAGSKVVYACLFPGSLALCCLAFKLRRTRLASCLLLLMGLFVATSGLSGCGSFQQSGTPPGTYNFLITATGQTGVSQFVNMTMTITK